MLKASHERSNMAMNHVPVEPKTVLQVAQLKAEAEELGISFHDRLLLELVNKIGNISDLYVHQNED